MSKRVNLPISAVLVLTPATIKLQVKSQSISRSRSKTLWSNTFLTTTTLTTALIHGDTCRFRLPHGNVALSISTFSARRHACTSYCQPRWSPDCLYFAFHLQQKATESNCWLHAILAELRSIEISGITPRIVLRIVGQLTQLAILIFISSSRQRHNTGNDKILKQNRK